MNWSQELKDTWGASPKEDQLKKLLPLSSLHVGQASSSVGILALGTRWHSGTDSEARKGVKALPLQ